MGERETLGYAAVPTLLNFIPHPSSLILHPSCFSILLQPIALVN